MAWRLARQVSPEAISWDNNSRGVEFNHQQAWRYLVNCTEPWLVVLEDDARPCLDFRHQLMEVLWHAPTPIVSLYLGRGGPDQWQLPISSVIARDVCFIRSDTLLHCVGYAVRNELIADMLRNVRHSVRHSSNLKLPAAISTWARRRHYPVSYSRPSLVDHADGANIIASPDSLPIRKAWLFDSRDGWDSTYADLPRPNARRSDRSARHLVVVKDLRVS